MKLTCSNCKYWVPSLESYCGLGAGSLCSKNMYTCTNLIKKINQIYFNRFIKEHDLKHNQLTTNCKLILKIIEPLVLLDEIKYIMLDCRGPFIEFSWDKLGDRSFNIKIFNDTILIQSLELNIENNKIQEHHKLDLSFNTSVKKFNENKILIQNILYCLCEKYIKVYTNIQNARKEIQDIFNSKVKEK